MRSHVLNQENPVQSPQVAFIAGCMYTGVGLFRLGWVTNFLSHAVISGFMTGAAVTIGMSQVACGPPLSFSFAYRGSL